MKTLYLDCGMGAAGDMLTAALIELLPDPDGFMERLNALGIPGVAVTKKSSEKCGITGTHIEVTVNGMAEYERHHHKEHEHHHHHRHHHHHHHHHHHKHHHHEHGHGHGMARIAQIVSQLDLPTEVEQDVLAVYHLIAEAESHAHGKPVTEIHFHEVGAMDAIADITAVCLLMRELAPDQVLVSPIRVGNGQVICAHGILPVPAPATAHILQGVPYYGGDIAGELCTPTGAALLKYFATDFCDLPIMTTTAIGYGMGQKDFPAANCVRALLGEVGEMPTDTVIELSCNTDDMTAESIGFAVERLLAEGALEVFTVPIGMKKSRPGTLLTLLCREPDRQKMIGLLFKHTSTIGVREALMRRYVLDRKIETVATPYGEVRRKVSSGYGVTRAKYEHDDLVRIAKELDISIEEVKNKIEQD